MLKTKHWTLTYDHLEDRPLYQAEEAQTVPFQLFDDDGTLYFTGFMSEALYDSHQVLDPLDYAIEVYGCTEMRVDGKTI